MRATCEAGVELVKRAEGLHRVVRYNPIISVAPYVCPAGYWTIGYGHLCGRDHPRITADEAEAFLIDDLDDAERAVGRSCPGWPTFTDGQFAALVDFVFNLGSGNFHASTLRRRVNAGEYADVPFQFSRWVYGGGRALPGLVARRAAEVELWLGG